MTQAEKHIRKIVADFLDEVLAGNELAAVSQMQAAIDVLAVPDTSSAAVAEHRRALVGLSNQLRAEST